MSYPPQLPHQPPAPPAKRRALPWILGGGGTVLVLCLIAGIIAVLSGGPKPTPTAAKTVSIAPAVAVAVPTTVPTTAAVKPKPADFTLKAKITRKACFGSAGCNVTFHVDVAYGGTATLDPETSWLIVYEINGIEDAPQVGNLEVTGMEVHGTAEVVSTTSTKSKITLTVTSVDES